MTAMAATATDGVGNTGSARATITLSYCLEDVYVPVQVDPNVDVQGDEYEIQVGAYEASRPDATEGAIGGALRIACSRPGVVPSTSRLLPAGVAVSRERTSMAAA